MMLETLPRYVVCKGKRYRLYADFRRVLLMMEISKDSRLTPAARTTLALQCVFRRIPASAKLREDLYTSVRRTLFPGGKRTKDRKLTDIDQDADLIRSAFRQVYGIDLWRDRLHWLEFTELLANLPEGNRYTEVVGIRAMPIPESTKHNAKYRQSIINAKLAFSLESSDEIDRMERYTNCVHSVAESIKAYAKARK